MYRCNWFRVIEDLRYYILDFKSREKLSRKNPFCAKDDWIHGKIIFVCGYILIGLQRDSAIDKILKWCSFLKYLFWHIKFFSVLN